MAASSLEEAYAMWTPARMREASLRAADDVMQALTHNAVPTSAAASADALKQDLAAIMLRQRPLREALALTNFALALLVAGAAAMALRMRPEGRTWLLQASGAAVGFAAVQIVVGAALAVEQAGAIGRHSQAILEAMQPAPLGLGALGDMHRWRWVAAIPPAVLGAIKAAFFAHITRVLRRPAVRALYERSRH
jgi:hypothetical protein